MPRPTSHRLLCAFLRPLAILAIVVGQGIFVGLPARSQMLRPAVRVAYVHHGDIWVLDELSGRKVRLTSDGHDFAPRWIANGQALLFCRGTRGGCEIWRWVPGKGHPQAGTRRLQDGVWSPDGTAVAITRVVNRAGSPTTVWVGQQGQMVRITPIQRGFRWYATAWSPDSGRLALGRIAIPPPTKPGQEIPPASAACG